MVRLGTLSRCGTQGEARRWPAGTAVPLRGQRLRAAVQGCGARLGPMRASALDAAAGASNAGATGGRMKPEPPAVAPGQIAGRPRLEAVWREASDGRLRSRLARLAASRHVLVSSGLGPEDVAGLGELEAAGEVLRSIGEAHGGTAAAAPPGRAAQGLEVRWIASSSGLDAARGAEAAAQLLAGSPWARSILARAHAPVGSAALRTACSALRMRGY